MAEDIEPADIRRIMRQARTVVDLCADQVRETVQLNGTWSEKDSDAELEETILTMLLYGLKARAERRGVDWSRIEEDTRKAMDVMSQLPATDLVQ